MQLRLLPHTNTHFFETEILSTTIISTRILITLREKTIDHSCCCIYMDDCKKMRETIYIFDVCCCILCVCYNMYDYHYDM